MNVKRREKNLVEINSIYAKLPQIQRELEADPTAYKDGCAYFTSLSTNLMRLAKYRQKLCEIRTTGDFDPEVLNRAVAAADSILRYALDRLENTYEAITEYEEKVKEIEEKC